MSSILKALRKVEDENAALGGGSVDLAHDILKRNYEQPRTRQWPLALFGFAVLLVVVALGGWLWFSSIRQPLPIAANLAPRPVVAEIVTGSSLPAADAGASENPTDSRQQTIKALAVEPQTVKLASESVVQVDLPDLRIDEIVYHQDPGARLAVVNDLPVMEGTVIDGVRIEEILPGSVRCSYQGVQFEKHK